MRKEIKSIFIKCDFCGREEDDNEDIRKCWILAPYGLDFCSEFCQNKYNGRFDEDEYIARAEDEAERKAHDPGILDDGQCGYPSMD